jgi:hypothetical protein
VIRILPQTLHASLKPLFGTHHNEQQQQGRSSSALRLDHLLAHCTERLESPEHRGTGLLPERRHRDSLHYRRTGRLLASQSGNSNRGIVAPMESPICGTVCVSQRDSESHLGDAVLKKTNSPANAPGPGTVIDVTSQLPLTKNITWASVVKAQQPLTIKDLKNQPIVTHENLYGYSISPLATTPGTNIPG